MSKSRIILLLLLIYPAYLTVHYGIRYYAETQIKNEVLAEIAEDPQLVSVFGGPYERATSFRLGFIYGYNYKPTNTFANELTEDGQSYTSAGKINQYILHTRPVNGRTYSVLATHAFQGHAVYSEYQLAICGEAFCDFVPEQVIEVSKERYDAVITSDRSEQRKVRKSETRFGHQIDIFYSMSFNAYGKSMGYAVYLETYPETYWDRLLRQLGNRSPDSIWSRGFYSISFVTGGKLRDF